MMHFCSPGVRTREPEALTVLEKALVVAQGVKISRPTNSNTPTDFGLAFETVHFTGAHGLKIEAWRIRQAESKGTVILFHGYAGSKDSLLAAAKEFDAFGYETLLVDFFGSGGSEGNETSVGFYEADDVAGACSFVQVETPGRRVILYGVSMGAAAVLRAVHAHGIAPSGLILECPFDRLITTVQNRFTAMGLPAFPAAQLLLFWGGVQQGFDAFQFNPADYARDVRCPVLFMHGGKDARVHLAEAENIFRNFRGPTVFKKFPSASHQSYLSSNASEWRSSVNHFLNGI